MLYRSPKPPARRGIVLLAVLIVLVLLTLAAYQYAELMTAEYRAVDSYQRSAQARAFAESGIHFAAAMLATPGSLNNPFDSPDAFSNVLVHQADTPRQQGRFSLVSPLGPDESATGINQAFRFGVTDEGGKINLNALLALDSSGKVAHDLLMGMNLPGMTEDVVNAIIDWIDPDDTPRASGAENSYYGTLTPTPYRCKNGPLDSLEELLLVRGVTPDLLFGNDLNRNGTLDPDEAASGTTLNRGWSDYLTIYSRELNVDSDGAPRIYVNDQDLTTLVQKLAPAIGPEMSLYLLAYRVYGPAQAGGGAVRPASQLTAEMIQTQNARPRAIASLYELINTQVSIPNKDPKGQPTRYACPLNDRTAQRIVLPVLLDKVTTSRDAELPGRINVNTAPRAVLAALPGITDADVQSILARRPMGGSADPSDPVFQSPAWLLTEANLRTDTLKTLERYVTARSKVYRVQSVGYFDGGGPTVRIEAVIDANNGKPRIVHWRDLTELGKGFDFSGMNK